MKTCRECRQQKPLTKFYKHSKMADGHLNKCIACVKERVAKHRHENRDKILAYDRARANNPDRVAARNEYAKSEKGRLAHAKANKAWRERSPIRRAAQVILGNALRHGKIARLPCFVCGEKAEAHHPDYDRPLDVVWLCKHHHQQVHNMEK